MPTDALSPAELMQDHARLSRLVESLRRLVSSGRWRWPGAAQDSLHRRLQALARLEARRHEGAPWQALLAHGGHAPCDPRWLAQAVRSLRAVKQGDASAAADVVLRSLSYLTALDRQLMAATAWINSVTLPTPSTRQIEVAAAPTSGDTSRPATRLPAPAAQPAAARQAA